MILEVLPIKKWEVKCDRCGMKKIVRSASRPPLPSRWAYKKVGPCGLTDYYRDEIRCPKCKGKE